MSKTYRIEIASKFTATKHTFWIGANLQLVSSRSEAALVTAEQVAEVMETIDCEASAYSE